MGLKNVLILGRPDVRKLEKLKLELPDCKIKADNVINKKYKISQQQDKPDIVIIFTENFNDEGIIIIKDMLKEIESEKISIILIGKEEKCSLFEKESKEFKTVKYLEQFSYNELKNCILTLLGYEAAEQEQIKDTKKIQEEKTILIVDDDSNILRIVSGYLEGKYRIAAVKSGMIALSYLNKNKPDLILLDYLMPGIDGKKTLEMIRDIEEAKNIPVIFLTGVSDKKTVMECINLRPEGYILKPVVKENLIEKVEKVLNSSER